MINLILIILLLIIYYIFFRKKIVIKKTKLINFHSDWCYWSKKLKPLWKELNEEMKFSNIEILDVKCDINKSLCDKYEIESYPTIKLINENKVVEYFGELNLDDIIQFIKNNIL